MIDTLELTIWLEYASPMWFSYSNRVQLKNLDKKQFKDFFEFWAWASDEIKQDFSDIIERKMDEYEPEYPYVARPKTDSSKDKSCQRTSER